MTFQESETVCRSLTSFLFMSQSRCLAIKKDLSLKQDKSI